MASARGVRPREALGQVVPAVPQRCLLPWGRIASRHIGETDCMAGVIGLEL